MSATTKVPERFCLRFKRSVKFPRFSMSDGETWNVKKDGGTGRDYLAAVESGEDRIDFAGGTLLLADVEMLPYWPDE